MKMRTFIGLCAALAFAAGSPGAYALKIFEDRQDDAAKVMAALAAVNGSFTYAAETLLMGTGKVTEASDDSDTATYYNIGGGKVNLAAPVGVAATMNDTYVVTVTLGGMVFQERLAADGMDLTGGTFSLATGGMSGDKLAVFRLTSGVVATSAVLNLAASFAISGNAGTATMTILNQTLAVLGIDGVTGRETHRGTVIKVAPALEEDAVAMNATADVAESFKKFLNEMTVASVGSLKVGANLVPATALRSAATGNAITALTDIILTEIVDNDPQSTVTFMGDFSFASMVYMHEDKDCGVAAQTMAATVC